jgi:CheY-like chemotaxis protein
MKKSYTILYADDDRDDLSVLSEAFEKYTDHLRVSHAYDGMEALRYLEHMKFSSTFPCLIILDINMSPMGGLEALKEIKKVPEYRHIPVVVFSTSRNPREKQLAQSLGADYITKPNRYNEWENLVDQFAQRCLIEARV